MNKINQSRSKFYKVWVGINNRVGKHKYYKNIKISESWKEFENFFNDMYASYCQHTAKHGERNTTIERVDRLGDYCKENCTWATMQEQANNRRNGRYLTYGGETLSLSQWSRKLNISRQALNQRLEDGWSVDKIMTTPKTRGRRFIVEELLKDVLSGKYGTKHHLELIIRLQDIVKML